MKAKLVVALFLGTVTFDSVINNQCGATMLKAHNKADEDDINDLVDQALNGGMGKSQKKPKNN